MTGLFTQLFSVFQGFFSRAFWFGGFLPVVVFAGIHAVIAAILFPESVPLRAWLAAPADVVAVFSAVLSAMVVLAYVLLAFLPLFQDLLAGTLMPPLIYDQLRAPRVQQT